MISQLRQLQQWFVSHCNPHTNVDGNGRVTKWKVFTPFYVTVLGSSAACGGVGIYTIVSGILQDNMNLILVGSSTTSLMAGAGCGLGLILKHLASKAQRLETQRQVAQKAIDTLSKQMQQTPCAFIAIDIDQNQNLEVLSDEMWCFIFDYLSLKDLKQASLVCKKWLNLTSDIIVWKKFVKDLPNDGKYCGKQRYITYCRENKIKKKIGEQETIYEKYNNSLVDLFKDTNGNESIGSPTSAS